MNWSQYLFSFNGRINRAKWWLLWLIAIGYVIAGVALMFVFGMIDPTLAFVVWILFMLGYLVLFFSSFAIGVKRLHDRNKTGWWLLVFYVLPWVLGVYAFSSFFMSMFGLASMSASGASQEAMTTGVMAAMQQMWWVSLVQLILFVWALVELGCLKGTTGDNQYGPDPLAGQS